MKKIILVFLLIVISACSEYQKIVRQEDYKLKYELANKLYEKGEFERTIVLFEQIYQHSPKSAEGELSYFRLAKSYFEIEDYTMSGYYFNNFIERFPRSKKTEDALFLNALSSVKNSPEYSLDQTDTEIAINNMQQFIDVYPNSSLIDSCNTIIDNLKFKLELKDFDVVKLYSKTQNYKAAVTAAEIFIEKYSFSKFKEEVSYLHVKNSILLSKNSIEAKKEERIEQSKERFLNFAEIYKNSVYLNELNTLIKSITN